MDDRYSLIQRNLELVKMRIEQAARRSGRKADDIQLVVVSKGQPVEVVQDAIRAGVAIFGENYPEETVEKIRHTQKNIQWHMIGHLQSRKITIITHYFHYFHSLDSLILAEKLNRQLAADGKTLPVLLELNVGGEVSKNGWATDTEEDQGLILGDIEKLSRLAHLKIHGLMTMPPYSSDPELSRVYFKKIKKIQSLLWLKFPQMDFSQLSMGTSFDFEVAIEEGATFIRVGEAILGKRPQH